MGEGGTLSRGVPWTIDLYQNSSVNKQAIWRYVSPVKLGAHGRF